MSVIVITGASSGIGRAAAIELARRGHELAVVGRNPSRTAEVAGLAGGEPFVADFDSIAEVRDLAARLRDAYPRIDVLANNAGGLIATKGLSADGIERTWQHNVLAPFVLTTELLPLLESSSARVLFTGSVAHRFGRVQPMNPGRAGQLWAGGWPAYGAAKRADIMLAKAVAERTALQSFSFHPGFVATRFGGLDSGPAAVIASRLQLTAEQGAAPLVHLVDADDPGVENGTYFDGLKPYGAVAAQVDDATERAKLWDALTRQAAKLPA